MRNWKQVHSGFCVGIMYTTHIKTRTEPLNSHRFLEMCWISWFNIEFRCSRAGQNSLLHSRIPNIKTRTAPVFSSCQYWVQLMCQSQLFVVQLSYAMFHFVLCRIESRYTLVSVLLPCILHILKRGQGHCISIVSSKICCVSWFNSRCRCYVLVTILSCIRIYHNIMQLMCHHSMPSWHHAEAKHLADTFAGAPGSDSDHRKEG